MYQEKWMVGRAGFGRRCFSEGGKTKKLFRQVRRAFQYVVIGIVEAFNLTYLPRC
jgi:hypothetical protein